MKADLLTSRLSKLWLEREILLIRVFASQSHCCEERQYGDQTSKVNFVVQKTQLSAISKQFTFMTKMFHKSECTISDQKNIEKAKHHGRLR